MKPLHTSYSNTGAWKFVIDKRTNNLTVVYNSKVVIISALIISAICIGFGLLGYNYVEAEQKILFLIIGIGTAFLLCATMLGTAFSENSKGPILTYSKSSDTLKIRDLKKTIAQASHNVAFSCEKYKSKDGFSDEDGGYRCEFNVLINGERTKFLSHSYINGFSPLIQFSVKAGIRVYHHTIEEKNR